jgi:hypothetical protein
MPLSEHGRSQGHGRRKLIGGQEGHLIDIAVMLEAEAAKEAANSREA